MPAVTAPAPLPARWHAAQAWLPGDDGMGHVARDVLFEVEGERFASVTPGIPPPPDARRLAGLVLPGLANAHSHAFHRAIRGRTERSGGDFWTWREQMYAVAAGLGPDGYRALARATFAEMALAGVTAVGEFHYLRNDPEGRRYADPNVMANMLAEAAREAGVRLTLLDACYLRGGFDRRLEGAQRRFADADADAWAARAEELDLGRSCRIGAAIHSVRAVDEGALDVVRDWAVQRDAVLHVHLSEQPAENAACVQATGRTPTRLLADHGVLGARTTAVHATHLTGDDVALLGGSGTTVCLCPTTERGLADGVGPAAALAGAGSPLSLGSDSHAVIDLFEECRAVELDERLVTGRRGHHRPEALLSAATAGGMAALGWDAGVLAPGRYADLVAVNLGSVRLAGTALQDAAAAIVFAATAADVTDVVNAGRAVVVDRIHLAVVDVGAALDKAIRTAVPA